MLRKLSIGITAAAMLGGCGGSNPTSTTVNGAAAGVQFQQPSALYNVTDDAVWVIVSDQADACARLSAPAGPFDRSTLVDDRGGHLPSLFLSLPREHFYTSDLRTIGDDLTANIDPASGHDCAGVDGGRCPDPLVVATSGTAHLLHFDDLSDGASAQARGTFDLQFPDAGSMLGSFVAKPCSKVQSTGCGSAGGGLALLPLLGLGLTLRRRRAC